MRKLSTVMGLVAFLGFTLASSALAGGPFFKAKPFEFVGNDPANGCVGTPGSVTAAWQTHEGLPDAGKSDHALFLQKTGPSVANCAAAGAVITGVEGITLTEIGFDIRNDGHCGAGAPRFNVMASDGFHFLGGCANGTQTPNTPAPGWMRVRIDPANPGQAFPPIAAGATIVGIAILFDEGTDAGPDFTGFAFLDNIDINGILIGKPGNAK